jgi:ABC-type Na+ efflux pump permease subunit
MAVGLSLLLIYNSLGIFALIMLDRGDLVEPSTIGLIFVYFILAYFMFASLMAAIGSAVNDLREAQSLMTPVIMMMMLPYIFFMPVIRAPNSMLATVSGFIPPISPFIMIMRVASTDPPPAWQVAASIAINMVAVVFFLWLAAKVFRVGLLMFGKPPNLRTLIKWVRMA